MVLGAWTPNPQVWAPVLLNHRLTVSSVTPVCICKMRILLSTFQGCYEG